MLLPSCPWDFAKLEGHPEWIAVSVGFRGGVDDMKWYENEQLQEVNPTHCVLGSGEQPVTWILSTPSDGGDLMAL